MQLYLVAAKVNSACKDTDKRPQLLNISCKNGSVFCFYGKFCVAVLNLLTTSKTRPADCLLHFTAQIFGEMRIAYNGMKACSAKGKSPIFAVLLHKLYSYLLIFE